jgi:hypothetical protein
MCSKKRLDYVLKVGSIVNMTGNLYDYLMSRRIFTLIMNRYQYELQKYEENDYEHNLELLIMLH